jgi:hypothetical protein
MEVISRTSRHYDPTLTYPNNLYGHGEIDAYRGLLDILGIDGIPEISTMHTPVSIALVEGRLRLVLPENLPETPFRIAVFTTNGTRVAQFEAEGRTRQYDFSLPTLPRGIYAVQINGSPAVSGSTLVRN